MKMKYLWLQREITNLGNALKGSEDIAGKLLTRLSLFGIAVGVVKEIGEAVYDITIQ